jgi:penicillin-binding protein 2
MAGAGARAEDWPLLGLPERLLSQVRDGMWAVVNEQQGTATVAKLEIPGAQMSGKTVLVQVRNVTREQREKGYKSENLPWSCGRTRCLSVSRA